MSAKIMAACWDLRLWERDKLLLLGMANATPDTGLYEVNLSALSALSEFTGYDEARVWRVIHELVYRGVIRPIINTNGVTFAYELPRGDEA